VRLTEETNLLTRSLADRPNERRVRSRLLQGLIGHQENGAVAKAMKGMGRTSRSLVSILNRSLNRHP